MMQKYRNAHIPQINRVMMESTNDDELLILLQKSVKAITPAILIQLTITC